MKFMELKGHLKLSAKLHYWCTAHCAALLRGLLELVRSPLSSLLTLLVIGIAMALPTGLFVLLKNLAMIAPNWQATPTISIYLYPHTSSQQLAELMGKIQHHPDIATIKYISPEAGLKAFMQRTQIGDAIGVLPENPLPGVIEVNPRANQMDPQKIETLVTFLRQLPAVDQVKIDLAWVKRWHSIVVLIERIIDGLVVGLGVGVILIVGNTIRLGLQQYGQEIVLLKLVGATNSFIRRPFLYRGALYGLFGGLIAWLIVLLFLYWLQYPLQLIIGWQELMQTGLIVTASGIFLGLLGARLVANQYLRAPEIV